MIKDWRIMGAPIQFSEIDSNIYRKHNKDKCLISGFTTKQQAEEYLREGIKNGTYRNNCYIKSQIVKKQLPIRESTFAHLIKEHTEGIHLCYSNNN